MSEQEPKLKYDIDTLFKDSHAASSGKNISCIIDGPSEIGKTFLAMDFPGPLKIINLDYGLTENLKYYLDKEITDMKCTSFVDAEVKLNDYKWDKVNPINSLKMVEAGLASLLKDMHGGTVIIDTMTTVNDWLKMLLDYKTDTEDRQTDGKIAIFDWKWVNMQWKWIWQLIKSIDANVVVLVRTKKIYKDFKETGKFEPDYRDGTKYEVSIEIELFEDIKQGADGKVTVKRMAKFNKFRGVNLRKDYLVENLSYAKLMEILKDEGKA